MKQIKLEVGKTYRSREGEKVKILKKDDTPPFQYLGEGGYYYTESGKWHPDFKDNAEDLIAEVPEARHTFQIPDGVKELTVEQVGNRIVVEMVPEKAPKPGDVMINKHGSVYIFKEDYGDGWHNHFLHLNRNGIIACNGLAMSGRPATPEEAQPLFDALKNAGKRWNAETMQVEDVPERERIMEFLKGYSKNIRLGHEHLCMLIESYLKHKEG